MLLFEGKQDEHEHGRRHQTLDGQAKSSIGHGNHKISDKVLEYY
jgi:hypothetical protein